MFIEDRPSIDNRFRTLIAVFFGADITLTVPCYRKRDIYQSKAGKMMQSPPVIPFTVPEESAESG